MSSASRPTTWTRTRSPDYLTRVVQPKLSSIAGVQRADISGAARSRCASGSSPEKMAAMGISPSQVRDALAQNNYLSTLGRTKGPWSR